MQDSQPHLLAPQTTFPSLVCRGWPVPDAPLPAHQTSHVRTTSADKYSSHMNGDNANAEELDGLSGAQMFSNCNGCRRCRSNTHTCLADGPCPACTHGSALPPPTADTYQDYIILPGHINFGADAVDTSTQARSYPRGGASRARPPSAPVLCAAPREIRRARTLAGAPPPSLLPPRPPPGVPRPVAASVAASSHVAEKLAPPTHP